MFPFDDAIMLIVNVAHAIFFAWYMYIIDSTNMLLVNMNNVFACHKQLYFTLWASVV